MIEDYYITGLPIKSEGLGTIYQPTIEDLLINGFTSKEIVQPFLIHVGILAKEDEKLAEVLKSFDLFFFMDNGLIEILIQSLSIIYKTKNIRVEEGESLDEMRIVVDESVFINRFNFDNLCDIVLGMFMANRPDKEQEEKVNLPTEKHRKIWEKLKESKRRKALKEQMNLCDIINVVCHTNNFIPYQTVIKFTYYQLLNSYKTMMKIENYREYTQIKLSPKYEVKTDVKHWMSDIKVSKVPSVD